MYRCLNEKIRYMKYYNSLFIYLFLLRKSEFFHSKKLKALIAESLVRIY